MDSGAAAVYIAYHNSSAYGCVHSYYGLQAHAAMSVPRTVKRFIATQMTVMNITITEGDASDPPLVIEGTLVKVCLRLNTSCVTIIGYST